LHQVGDLFEMYDDARTYAALKSARHLSVSTDRTNESLPPHSTS